MVPQLKIHRWCEVVGPTLGQQQCFNCWNVCVGPMFGQCQHANDDVLPTTPTITQRWPSNWFLSGILGDNATKNMLKLNLPISVNQGLHVHSTCFVVSGLKQMLAKRIYSPPMMTSFTLHATCVSFGEMSSISSRMASPWVVFLALYITWLLNCLSVNVFEIEYCKSIENGFSSLSTKLTYKQAKL